MDVAFQKLPASKIIYVTPQNINKRDLKQEDVKHVAKKADTVHSNIVFSGTAVQNEKIIIKPTAQVTPTRNEITVKPSVVKADGGNSETDRHLKYYTECMKAQQLPLQNGGGDVPSKSVAGTQTSIIQKSGHTVFDEMKKKAGEAFRKLDIYQISNQSEKKSVLLPGTDSEYRTPGAHYRNKNGQIKRPMNAFMVWAREFRGKLAAAMPNATNSDISVKLGQVWSSLPQEQKRQYYNIAEQIKVKHRQDFPDWVYKPLPGTRKKEILPPDGTRSVNEPVTSPFQQRIPVPSMPFVKLMADVNQNQSASTATTRIPVILQPIMYQHGSPTVSQVVKDRLVDKISAGTGTKQHVYSTYPVDVKPNVRDLHVTGSQLPIDRNHGDTQSFVLPTAKTTEHELHVSGNQATDRIHGDAQSVIFQTAKTTEHEVNVRRNQLTTDRNHGDARSVVLQTAKTIEHPKLGQLLTNPEILHAQIVKHLPLTSSRTDTTFSRSQPMSNQCTIHEPVSNQNTLHDTQSHINSGPSVKMEFCPESTERRYLNTKSAHVDGRTSCRVTHSETITRNVPDKDCTDAARTSSSHTIYGNTAQATGNTTHANHNGYCRTIQATQDVTTTVSDGVPTTQQTTQQPTFVASLGNPNRQVDMHQFEHTYGAKWLEDSVSSGKPYRPMYLELLDPFDPLMDCDFLYSEIYPGCLHLDVPRWREYLDISSDGENDPLSLFQDESDEDIKISPVPLKESLRRMCNAHVQRSASGDIITGDVLIPIS